MKARRQPKAIMESELKTTAWRKPETIVVAPLREVEALDAERLSGTFETVTLDIRVLVSVLEEAPSGGRSQVSTRRYEGDVPR